MPSLSETTAIMTAPAEPEERRYAGGAVVLDDTTLARLAALMNANQPPARPAWQAPLLATLVGAVILGATTGYFSLRSSITDLGDSLRTEIGSVENSLRTEMGRIEDSLRTEIANHRAETREGFKQVNATLLDHTDRLARLEEAAGLARIDN